MNPSLKTPPGGDEKSVKEWEGKMTRGGRTNTQTLVSLWPSISNIV